MANVSVHTATMVESQQPAAQLFPRLHLYGIAQELRDMIYEHVFKQSKNTSGATNLVPLLTSRKFYHESHGLAWASTTFDISNSNLIAKGINRRFQIEVPPSDGKKLKSIKIDIEQLEPFYSRHLPQIDILHVGKECSNDCDDGLICSWYNLRECLFLKNKIGRFELSPLAFTDLEALSARNHCLDYSDPPEHILTIERRKASPQSAFYYEVREVWYEDELVCEAHMCVED